MTRETYKTMMAIGVMLNSALYLGACFIAGLVSGNALAWRLAMVSIGITYLSYLAQFVEFEYAHVVVWLSIACGVATGIALLF